MHQHPHPLPTRRRRRLRVLGAGLAVAAASVSVAAPGASATTAPAPQATRASDGPYGPFGTAAELVDQTYQDVLRRDPTAAERQVATAALEGGQTPAEFVVALTETAESNANVRSVIRLYRAYYLRNPDHGGLGYWILQRRAGATLSHISNQFAAAPEFSLRYGRLDDGQFVDLVYQNVLDRGPDAKGRAYWIDLLGQGLYRGQLMTKFSESPEYVSKSFGVVTTVQLYDALFRRGIARGLSDAWAPSVQSGKTTPVELAATFLADVKYTGRFS